MTIEIRRAREARSILVDGLVDLLVDAVRNGSSIGFLWPLSRATAERYWREVFKSLDDDHVVWIALEGEKIVGSVQLGRSLKENGRHRAEIMKLMVHSEWRRRGVSAELLAAAEAYARASGCLLLVLDTEVGSVAETVYRRLGWSKSGEIPDYATTPDGSLAATAYFYKRLQDRAPMLQLVRPAREHLGGYVAALKAGWSTDNLRGTKAAEEALARIEANADEFLAQQVDRDAKGPEVTMPDGSKRPRIPGYVYWMWDGDFCGAIGFRWQPGTTALPPYTLGHIGYAVVPWKRQRGYAKTALALMLEHVRNEGLEYVEITCDPDNTASQRTIVANGGVLVERFVPPPVCGSAEKLRYRITL
jgi:predicted acetyltransferase